MTRKAHHAQVLKAAAQENIEHKLTILHGWLSHGIPCVEDDFGNKLLDNKERKILEYFPSSVRQFKLWDGTQNSPRLRALLPSFSATGNDTLSKRPESVEQVERVTKALKLRAEQQLNEGRHSALRKLESELDIARAAIDLRVSELRNQQRQIRNLKFENGRLRQEQHGHISELRRLLDQSEAALAQERQRNADLSALISKISPIGDRSKK